MLGMESGSTILFFGFSADPPHSGHIEMVNGALTGLARRGIGINRTLVVPTFRRNPVGVRKDRLPSTFPQRLKLAQLAFDGIADVSDIERTLVADSDQPNYTATTLQAILGQAEGATEIYLLLSSEFFSGDAPQFERWHQVATLLQLATLLIVPRSGHSVSFDYLVTLKQRGGSIIFLDEVTLPAVSSSTVRERLLAGDSAETLAEHDILPIAVAQWLSQHGRSLQQSWLADD